MNAANIFGLIVLLIGVFLVGYGIRSSQTFTNRVVGGVTGRYTRTTMWYLIGGAILVLVGGALMFWGGHWPAVIHP